ncbi:hypothetical protein JCM12298_31490 [Desulfothermus naphthae]
MKYEYHAYFAFVLKDSTTQAYAIDYLVGKSSNPPLQWKEIAFIKDDYARLEILAQARVTGHKESVRMGSRKDPTGLYYWIKHRSENFLKSRSIFMHKIFATNPPLPDLSLFPPGSWVIQVHFTLRKPYISKDDVDLYVIDNPVKKEWIFKVPYVAPSQWKGSLRAAMRRLRGYTTWEEEAKDEQMVRLFGNVKGEEADFSAGCLNFYPTFFNRIDIEVINPHPRDTGAGKQPIYFESVPAGTPGIFTLLYVPLYAGSKDIDTAKTDLHAIARGICAMLTEYGFGAKTSSGYGVVDVIKKQSAIRAQGFSEAEKIFWETWNGEN